MRILFVTNELGTGGAEKLVVGYALEMSRRGHRVGVVFSNLDSQADPLQEAGIDLFRVSPRGLKPSTLFTWVSRLRGVVRDFGPDVFHAQSVTSGLAARMASPRTPLLVTIHGISKSNEAPAAFLLRMANVRLTAVSGVTAEGLNRHPWAPRVEILGSGVDADQLSRAAQVADPPELIGTPSLVCVARQDHVKGVDVHLRAMPTLVGEHPAIGLTLVGWGTEFEANQKLADDLGVRERTSFTGLLPYATPHLGAADVVILPSRREGLPIVALEALALERPLVATDVGGTSSAVVDGETGWLIPPDDPSALAAAVLECLADPVEAARRARAGRELVEQCFGSGPMLDKVEDLLRAVASTRSHVPRGKPRVYHHAVRTHQQARIAAWKLSSRRSSAWHGVRIFGYHRVSDDNDIFCVSPAGFRAHMLHLRESDTQVIPLWQALDLLEEPVEGRYVCVTFDDGYLDTVEHALPVLEDLGLPATIFVISDVLEGRVTFDWYRTPPPHFGVADLARIHESGLVDIQAHSRTHPRLTALTEDELHGEVAGSKAQLERHVPPLTSFSYPAGIYGPREIEAVFQAGFRAGIATTPGVNLGAGGLGALNRTMIYWRDDVERFGAKLAGATDAPSRLSEWLRSRRSRPGDGQLAGAGQQRESGHE
jgi:glycosyltransferase involved in cell wall biosynthesis/peptidoglycan/xylan/chitin deacetylase (PgdA/CDA1 family)